MKTLLKVSLLTTGILALSAPAVLAQDATTTAPAAPAPAPAATAHAGGGLLLHRAAIRHYLARQLGLSSDQIAQLKATRTSTATTIKSIRADTSLTPDQQKAKIHETLKNARAQMRSVLTSDQQAKLDEMRRNFRQAAGV